MSTLLIKKKYEALYNVAFSQTFYKVRPILGISCFVLGSSISTVPIIIPHNEKGKTSESKRKRVKQSRTIRALHIRRSKIRNLQVYSSVRVVHPRCLKEKPYPNPIYK